MQSKSRAVFWLQRCKIFNPTWLMLGWEEFSNITSRCNLQAIGNITCNHHVDISSVYHQELQLGIQSLTSVTHRSYSYLWVRFWCFFLVEHIWMLILIHVHEHEHMWGPHPQDRYCSNLRDQDLGEWVCNVEIGEILRLVSWLTAHNAHTLTTTSGLSLVIS